MRDAYWAAIVDCDKAYDGVWYYGVKTTRIFCRPSCPSRTPNKENVVIFNNNQQPLEDGFRPCKRCRPDLIKSLSSKDDTVNKARELLAASYIEDWTLNRLAEHLYISPFYLQRIFKQHCGLSPAAYLAQKRMEVARALLTGTDLSIAEVAVNTGFQNTAYFSSLFHKMTGIAPGKFRAMNRKKA